MGETNEIKVTHGPEPPTEDSAAPREESEQGSSRKKERKSKEIRISSEELQQLQEKAALADEYYDRLLHLQADFDNFRKRKEKERLDLIKFSTESFVSRLVPVLCNFERALTVAERVPQVKAFTDGIELILKQLKKILQEQGIEEICPVDVPFDPYKHEAVEKVFTAEHPEGHVLDVLQIGYALNDRVVQPAVVRVAAAPPKDQEGKKRQETSRNEGFEDRVEEETQNE
jgi:molecular chaperone GrpE